MSKTAKFGPKAQGILGIENLKKLNAFLAYFVIHLNFLNNYFKIQNLKISIKFVKILELYGGYFLPSTKNKNMDFI